MSDRMSQRQLGFSVFAGLCGPLAVCCGALPWPGVLLGLAVAGLTHSLLALAVPLVEQRGTGEWPAPLRGASLLWTVLLMAKAADLSLACFPDGTGYIPLILLALAAAAAQRGAETCGRLGAILWILLAALFGVLLVCAAQDFSWTRFAAAHGTDEGWLLVTALALSPAALLALPCRQSSSGLHWGYWMAAGAGLAVSVVCCGVLGPLRRYLAQPLYALMQGISLLGVAERLEPLLSAALSVSYFMALSLLCASGAAQVRQLASAGAGRWHSSVVAAAALALYRPAAALPASAWVWMAGGFGVALPAMAAFWPHEKKVEREEKST